MDMVTLGRTGITVNKNGFGALPIQRVSREEAARLLRMALDAGITFFDTARFYTDSEEKIGYALSDRRDAFYLATKTAATTAEGFWSDLETSLRNLKTDYIDIYQFHNPAFCPKPGDGSGLYEAMLEARRQGKIRFISITNHRMTLAHEAIRSGLYDTLQFPFCYLATDKDIYPHSPPPLTAALAAVVERDRAQLQGNFCRGCGYCMPCPAGLELNNCARMSLMIRRAPREAQLTPEMQEKMARIEQCLHCNQCARKCPYGLDTPKLLEDNYRDYREILAGKAL